MPSGGAPFGAFYGLFNPIKLRLDIIFINAFPTQGKAVFISCLSNIYNKESDRPFTEYICERKFTIIWKY